MDKIRQSLSYKLNEIKESWTGFIQELFSREDIGDLFDSFSDLSSGLQDALEGIVPILKSIMEVASPLIKVIGSLADAFGSLTPFLIGGGIMAAKNKGIFKKDFFKSFNFGETQEIKLYANVDDTKVQELRGFISAMDNKQIDLFIKEHGNSDELRTYVQSGNVTTSGINDIINNQNATQFANQAKGIKGVKVAIDEYNKASALGQQHQEALVGAINKTNKNLGDYLSGLGEAEATMGGYGFQLVKAKIKSIALTVATTAMNAAITMGVSALISLIAVPIANFFDDMINGEKNAKKAFEEAKTAAKEARDELNTLNSEHKSNAKTVEDITDKYAKLAQGYDFLNKKNKTLDNDQLNEFYELNNKLGELFPTLTKNYDENNQAIYDLDGSVESITEKIQKLVKVQDTLARSELKNKLQDVVEGVENDDGDRTGGQLDVIKGYEEEIEKQESYKKQVESFLNSVNNKNARGTLTYSSEGFAELERLYGEDIGRLFEYDSSSGYWFSKDFSKMSEKDYEIIKKYLSDLVNTYTDEIDNQKLYLEQANKEMSDSMMIWLEDDAYYKTLSSNPSMQKAIQNMVGNIDWNSLEDIDSLEDAEKYIKNNILNMFQKIGNDSNKKIELTEILNNLFSLDTSNMSYGEIESAVANYKDKLWELVKDKYEKDGGGGREQFELDFGIKLNTYISEEAQNNKNALVEQLIKLGFSEETAKKIIGSLTEKEINYVVQTKISLEPIVSTTDSEKENQDAIQDAIKGSEQKEKKNISFKKAWKEIDDLANSKIFENMSDSDKSKISKFKEEAEELANTGSLTSTKLENLKGFKDFFDKTGINAEDAAEKINSFVDSSKHLEEVNKGVSSILGVYDEKKENKDNKPNPNTLASVYDTLGIKEWEKEDKKVWEDYKDVAEDPKASLKDLKKEQDKLATTWFASKGFLENLNNENKNYYINTLKSIGVTNADAVVKEKLSEKNGQAKIDTLDLKDATSEEIIAISKEIGKTDTAINNIEAYGLKKIWVTKLLQ